MIHALCDVAGRGGNLLLNVSPRGDGTLPPVQVELLEGLGGWMKANGESIVDTRPGLEPWQFYGPSTRRGDRLYLHLLMRPYESFTVRGLPVKHVSAVRELSRQEPLAFTTRTTILDMLNADPPGEVTVVVPEHLLDSRATVVVIDIDDDIDP